MADNIFTYENVKNDKEIRYQWLNYILQKFKDRPSWSLLAQSLGDNNTLQIDKLTPESFNTLTKIYGAPAIDTTPIRPPLMQKSAQQTPDNQKDFVPAVEPATQNDKTGKPVVVTGGQPSNGKPSKKTIGWSSGNGYMYEDDHPNNWRTSYGNSGKIKDRDTYTRGSIPGSMGLSYTEPSQVQMTRNDAVPETFSDSDWNAAHGISYVTGKDGLIYRIDPQHPNGYVDPFKNDLSKTGSTGYATGKGMLTSSTNDTYATGEGIKDANGNVLTNPGGDWEYQYALKNPQYGLGMMGKMSDAQKEYLQAVSDDMGYKYNFKGANRYV